MVTSAPREISANVRADAPPRAFAVAYATIGAAFVLFTENLPEGEKPELTRMQDPAVLGDKKSKKKPDSKQQFLTRLQPGDHVYLELGGAGDRLALAAYAFGAKVFRYPSFKLGKDDVDRILGEHTDWVIPEERAHGDETGDKLTARKRRGYALLALARTAPNDFMEVEDRHVNMLRLAMEFRAFKKMQRRIIATTRALVASYYDRALVQIGLAKQRTASREEHDIYNVVLEQLMHDMLGGDIPASARENFLALIGAEFPEGIPQDATHEDIERLVEVFMESDAFESTILDRLKELGKRIEKLLKGGKVMEMGQKVTLPPNVIWEKVFAPIPGMGPLLAAPIITEIGDIRGFRSRPALTAAAGYHHMPDGSRARRVKGQTSSWKPRLKQAVYLWTVQTVKMPNSPWREKLDCRKAYELYKLLRDRQTEADKGNEEYEILPKEYRDTNSTSMLMFERYEYALLAEHVDALRKRAGVAVVSDDEGEEEEAAHTVKDPALAKYVKGIKGMAHAKGLRWLGQQLLKHIWREWRLAIGLPEDVPHKATG